MRLWAVAVSCVLVLGGSLQAMAQQQQQQQQSGPRTLEALVQTVEAEKPPAAPEAEQKDAGPKRPAGTLNRPKDGVQHPDLDKAWAAYDAAVAKVTESIKTAIAKQFDAATAKGDLDAAEKWQAALEKFEKAGEVPTEKEAKTALSAAVFDYKKAREELTKAYEAVVKSLTMEKRLPEARAARAEAKSLVDGPAQSPKVAAAPEPIAKFADVQTRNVATTDAKETPHSKTRKPVEVEIKSNSEIGYEVGEVRKGQTIVFQFLRGSWKGWGNLADINPDGTGGRGGLRCRLAIAEASLDGKTAVLELVSEGTVTTPYRYEVNRDIRRLVLRMNDDDGNWGNNHGSAWYRITIE